MSTDRRPCWACGKRAFWGERFGWLCPEHAQAAHDSDRADADLPKPSLPKTLAGRIECISEWLAGPALVDDNGEPTGERGAPLITREQAVRLMEAPHEATPTVDDGTFNVGDIVTRDGRRVPEAASRSDDDP